MFNAKLVNVVELKSMKKLFTLFWTKGVHDHKLSFYFVIKPGMPHSFLFFFCYVFVIVANHS